MWASTKIIGQEAMNTMPVLWYSYNNGQTTENQHNTRHYKENYVNTKYIIQNIIIPKHLRLFSLWNLKLAQLDSYPIILFMSFHLNKFSTV